MQSLFAEYPQRIVGNDVFDVFKSFYSRELSSVIIWLKTKFLKRKYAKNSLKSRKFRNDGNRQYSRGKYADAAKSFTIALNYAEDNTEEYSLALANRSAALFHLQEFKACIEDIDNCIKFHYPSKLQHKVYVRKAECLEKLGCLTEDFVQVAKNIILSNSNLTEEEKGNQVRKIQLLDLSTEKVVDTICVETDIDFRENPNFAYASESIKLCYDSDRGRHVRAARNIAQGEILFIEDAFFFAPIFTEDELVIFNKCHHCLSDIEASVPCKTCALFMYCDETCRDKSWNEFHKWECVGMTAGIWYDLGIAFPAFRAVVKGLKSHLAMPDEDYDSNINKFGDKEDNYLYFNKLLTNIQRLESLTQILVLSAVVIKYLERETNFFSYVEQQLKFLTVEEIKMKCGGLLMRHMLQLSGNSSVIEHWNKSTNRINSDCSQIACAIYPSVSMMNHSCKANITMYYNKAVVIVKVLHDIKENEEVFNCYGVDYRYTNFETRQSLLKSLYHFSCKCEICSNSLLEYDMFDSYLCQSCQGPLSIISGICYNCKKPAFLDFYKKLESEANSYIEKEPLMVDDVHKCYKIRTSIYVKNHIKISECLDMYSLVYKNEGNLIKMLEYFKQSLNLRKTTIGCNARSLAIETINIVADIIEELKQNPSLPNRKDLLKEIGSLYASAHKITLLYYPQNSLKLTDIDKFVEENSID